MELGSSSRRRAQPCRSIAASMPQGADLRLEVGTGKTHCIGEPSLAIGGRWRRKTGHSPERRLPRPQTVRSWRCSSWRRGRSRPTSPALTGAFSSRRAAKWSRRAASWRRRRRPEGVGCSWSSAREARAANSGADAMAGDATVDRPRFATWTHRRLFSRRPVPGRASAPGLGDTLGVSRGEPRSQPCKVRRLHGAG
jgi:hypothetical protein